MLSILNTGYNHDHLVLLATLVPDVRPLFYNPVQIEKYKNVHYRLSNKKCLQFKNLQPNVKT